MPASDETASAYSAPDPTMVAVGATHAVTSTGQANAATLVASTGAMLGYDDLALATGSSAPVPELPGREHIRVYRTVDDVDALVAELAALTDSLGRTPRVVVAGDGILGLEAARAIPLLRERTDRTRPEHRPRYGT